jgi:hypothetical protein
MESSYLKILTSSASTYQKFGNIYRTSRTTSCEIKGYYYCHTLKKKIENFKIKGSTKLDAIYNGVSEHFMPITDENELLRVKTSIIYLTTTFSS